MCIAHAGARKPELSPPSTFRSDTSRTFAKQNLSFGWDTAVMRKGFRRTWTAKVGIAALIAGGLAAGGYGIAQAAVGSASRGATSSAVTASSGSSGSSAGSGYGWPGGGPLLGGGFRGFGGFGPARGTVETVQSGSFTLKTGQGTTLTIDTTGSTTYYEALSKVSASALKSGEQVSVVFTRPSASAGTSTSSSVTPTAARVDIILPSLEGQVVSDSAGTIVVSDREGFHRTIDTTGSTTYSEAGTTVPASAVTNGVDVVAYGSIAANKTDLNAMSVEVVGPVASGKVTKLSGTTITVSLPQGTSMTITTTSSTIFESSGKASSLSSVKVGDMLVVIGTRESNGTFAATAVRFGAVSEAPGAGGWVGFAGPGRSGFGGFPGVGLAGPGGAGAHSFGGFGGFSGFSGFNGAGGTGSAGTPTSAALT